MSRPRIHLQWPNRSLIKLRPDHLPSALAPPTRFDYSSPIAVKQELFEKSLEPSVPITIAAVYVITVCALNAYNRSQGNKPWAISKTRAFFAFVIVHNIALAVYSAATFAGMSKALNIVNPGWNNPNGLTGIVDSVCKIHGPRGLGNAAAYNITTSRWEMNNPVMQLTSQGLPDATDVGRLWNEGLAFWGWFFYLSKFYEVLDTFIIIAKGKRSSTLQTYHHAGAMLGMWAGIRFMSPPIFMFVQFNSGVHAMMYTYYTISALGVRVPQPIKRTLTTLQISQFVIGTTYAMIHLFIAYDVPVSAPQKLVNVAATAVSAVSAEASSVIQDIPSITAAVSAGFGSYLKGLLLRAADEEGVAENVHAGSIPIPNMSARPSNTNTERQIPIIEDIKNTWQTEYNRVPCIDTSGEAFAILLNVMYLLPLTVLFVRFFTRSYSRRVSANSRRPVVAKSIADAAHGVNREVETIGKTVENGFSPNGFGPKTNGHTEPVVSQN